MPAALADAVSKSVTGTGWRLPPKACSYHCARNDDPTIGQWQEQLQCAKLLKANIVTDLRSLGVPEGQEDIDGSDFSHRIVAMADENDVRLCIETGRLKTLLNLGKRFDSIGYCFDSGFANLDKQFSFKEFVDNLGSRITHLHLTDNYGQCDDHAPIGVQGGISRENWDYLLQTLNKYDHDVIACLEMQPPFPGVLIRQACEFLFDQLQWPNRPEKLPKISSLSLTTG